MKCRILIFICYFAAFSCFSSAVFLPQGLQLLKFNSQCTAESIELKADVTINTDISQTVPKKNTVKKPKPEIIPSYYGYDN